MSTKGYKVCSINSSGVLRSAIVTGGAKIYSIGGITKRSEGCGPLAVFHKFADAVRFARQIREFQSINTRIFSCEYKPSRNKTLWYTEPDGYKDIISSKRPEGTRYADEVTLIKEVDFFGQTVKNSQTS